ncbi:adenine-specific methyltransferase EcoRI family protein [uncultured Oscillibacter sp.]|uniref:adenine-specific methyltransferase EcoRI family protein n=1 Tax=uncultured Oscillibacter sp. TaxID=876091 RepID=UPI0025D13FEA|nr:adenine-specific methyltransferase EcoRI family protein [uncultured Oscillibacter sp.]
MATSERLKKSRETKNDEFYTLWQDIADEIPLYREQLRGKRIICPCDWDESFEEALVYKEGGYISPQDLFSEGGSVKLIDVEHSKEKLERDLNTVKCNFVKFLVSHAEAYGIKSISVSGYDPATGKGVRFQDVDYSKYDIVITNPPFSQFREFIDVMFTSKAKFLVIGPAYAVTYTDTFEHIKSNEMWLGYHHHMTGFMLPTGEVLPKNDALVRYCCWYTNLDVSYRHDKMILTEKYDPKKFPTYYNFDGIDVNKTLSIPYDYDGYIGVPITFLQKYNPNQFQIIDLSIRIEKKFRFNGDKSDLWYEKDGKPWKCPFRRMVIRNKEVYHDADDN